MLLLPFRAAEPARAPREAGRGGAVRPGRSRQCFSPCSTAIRRDAHLHHLLFSRSSHTLLLRDRAAVATDAAASLHTACHTTWHIAWHTATTGAEAG